MFSIKSKNKSSKNMLLDAFSGTINFKQTQNDESKGPCPGQLLKFNFLDESISFCATSNDIDVGEINKDVLKDIAIVISYLIESEIEKAYYVVNENIMYTFDGYGNNYSFSVTDLGGIDAAEMAETFFEAEAHTRIDETINQIKNTYSKKKYTKEIFFGLLMLFLIYYVITYFQENDIALRINKTPKPNYPTVTEKENLIIERGISLDLLNEIEKLRKEYKANRLTFAKKRISVFSMSGFKSLPKDQASTSDEIHWRWDKGGNRRGGKQAMLRIIEQQTFPGVGYDLASDGIYQKTKTVTFKKNGDYVDQNLMKFKRLKLTEKCLVSVLRLAILNTKPKKRNSEYTEIELIKMSPSEIATRLAPLVKQCPIVINRVLLSPKGKFDISISVFKTTPDQNILNKRKNNVS